MTKSITTNWLQNEQQFMEKATAFNPPVKTDSRQNSFLNEIIDYNVPVVVFLTPQFVIPEDSL